MSEDQLPLWRRKLAERPPTASWWLRRHHCSDVVLGESKAVDKTDDTVIQSQDLEGAHSKSGGHDT